MRLKEWRRGIQDVDYLGFAQAINAQATQDIINTVVPSVLWEYAHGPTMYPVGFGSAVSWSVDPDRWEAARAKLAAIIVSHSGK